jgi:hypothetical protein
MLPSGPREGGDLMRASPGPAVLAIGGVVVLAGTMLTWVRAVTIWSSTCRSPGIRGSEVPVGAITGDPEGLSIAGSGHLAGRLVAVAGAALIAAGLVWLLRRHRDVRRRAARWAIAAGAVAVLLPAWTFVDRSSIAEGAFYEWALYEWEEGGRAEPFGAPCGFSFMETLSAEEQLSNPAYFEEFDEEVAVTAAPGPGLYVTALGGASSALAAWSLTRRRRAPAQR